MANAGWTSCSPRFREPGRPAADPEELRWRRFVHAAVATETPFSTGMGDLRRSVRLLQAVLVPRLLPIVAGPSGL